MKRWRLTTQAEMTLADIAEWTARHFGVAQAIAYRDALIDRINKLASGQPPHGRPCDVLLRGKRSAAGLRYYREGSHYLVFREREDTLVVLDFFHGHMDLDHHIAELVARARNDARDRDDDREQ